MDVSFAVSLVHAARSTLRMMVGTTAAARMAMTDSTAIISITVQPADSGTGVSTVRIVQPTHGRDARATTDVIADSRAPTPKSYIHSPSAAVLTFRLSTLMHR